MNNDELSKQIETLISKLDAKKYTNLVLSLRADNSKEKAINMIRKKVIQNPNMEIMDIIDDVEFSYYL